MRCLKYDLPAALRMSRSSDKPHYPDGYSSSQDLASLTNSGLGLPVWQLPSQPQLDWKVHGTRYLVPRSPCVSSSSRFRVPSSKFRLATLDFRASRSGKVVRVRWTFLYSSVRRSQDVDGALASGLKLENEDAAP